MPPKKTPPKRTAQQIANEVKNHKAIHAKSPEAQAVHAALEGKGSKKLMGEIKNKKATHAKSIEAQAYHHLKDNQVKIMRMRFRSQHPHTVEQVGKQNVNM